LQQQAQQFWQLCDEVRQSLATRAKMFSTTHFNDIFWWQNAVTKCCLFPLFRAARRFARTFCHQKNRWNFIGISSKMNLADW